MASVVVVQQHLKKLSNMACNLYHSNLSWPAYKAEDAIVLILGRGAVQGYARPAFPDFLSATKVRLIPD